MRSGLPGLRCGMPQDGGLRSRISPTSRTLAWVKVRPAERGTARGDDATRHMQALVPGALVCDLPGEKTCGREVGFCRTPSGLDINREIIRIGGTVRNFVCGRS